MSCAGTPTQDSQDPRLPDIFATMEETCSETMDPVLDVGCSTTPSLPSHLAPPDHVMFFLSFPPGAFEGRKMLVSVAYDNAQNIHCHYPQHSMDPSGWHSSDQTQPEALWCPMFGCLYASCLLLSVAHHVPRARMIFSSGQDGEVPSGCLTCLALHGQLVKWTASSSPKPVTSQVPRQAVYH